MSTDPMSPFDPAHAGSFLISLYNEFLFFFRIALSGFKYAVSTTGFTMILWITVPIFDNFFAVTFTASMYFRFNLIVENPLVELALKMVIQTLLRHSGEDCWSSVRK